MSPCTICTRLGVPLTRHHLLPQCRQNKPRFARHHTRQEGLERIALLCKACHSFVHSTLSEKELEQRYNTIEALLEHEEIRRFANWIRSKPPGYQLLSRKKSEPRG